MLLCKVRFIIYLNFETEPWSRLSIMSEMIIKITNFHFTTNLIFDEFDFSENKIQSSNLSNKIKALSYLMGTHIIHTFTSKATFFLSTKFFQKKSPEFFLFQFTIKILNICVFWNNFNSKHCAHRIYTIKRFFLFLQRKFSFTACHYFLPRVAQHDTDNSAFVLLPIFFFFKLRGKILTWKKRINGFYSAHLYIVLVIFAKKKQKVRVPQKWRHTKAHLRPKAISDTLLHIATLGWASVRRTYLAMRFFL